MKKMTSNNLSTKKGHHHVNICTFTKKIIVIFGLAHSHIFFKKKTTNDTCVFYTLLLWVQVEEITRNKMNDPRIASSS